MKISTKDMHHGGALIQVAEFPTFKAINSFELSSGANSTAAFVINNNAGVYFKYATKPSEAWGEYVFGFNKSHFDELDALKAKYGEKVYIALVCVKAREVCLIKMSMLSDMRAERVAAKGSTEEQYQLLVSVPENKGFRVYMNKPDKKKTTLKQRVVNRNNFPKCLFDH